MQYFLNNQLLLGATNSFFAYQQQQGTGGTGSTYNGGTGGSGSLSTVSLTGNGGGGDGGGGRLTITNTDGIGQEGAQGSIIIVYSLVSQINFNFFAFFNGS